MGRTVSTPVGGMPSIVASINQGGTSATTVANAAANLGLVSQTDKNAASGVAALNAASKLPTTLMKTTGANGLVVLGGDGKLPSDAIPSSVGGITVSGNTNIVTSSVNTYTITNYDISTTYTVGVSAGSVSQNGAAITLNAPSTPQAITLTVNGKAFAITVFTPTVNQTSITSPTAGATGQGSSVSFTSSAFATTGQSDTHQSSDWQIATDVAFTNVVASVTASTANLTSWTASGLTANTTYYVRCRHKGTTLSYGAWSTAVSFSTKTSFYPTTQQSKIAGTVMSSYFGSSISISADGMLAVIGTRRYPIGGSIGVGIVSVYKRSGSTWSNVATLQAADYAADDQFGYSVAISGDGLFIVVGAYQADVSGQSNVGAAYVFAGSNDYTTWTQQTKLVPNNGLANDLFGSRVAINSNGTMVLVGAYASDAGGLANGGMIYIWTRSGATWSFDSNLTPLSRVAGAEFATSMALSADGNTLAVGAPAMNSNKGIVYVFTKNGSVWSQQTMLATSDGANNDKFGWTVNLSADGNTLICGATGTNTAKGAVYVFTRSGTTWSQQAKVVSNASITNGGFGWYTSLMSDGSVMAVSEASFTDTVNQQGVVRIFKNNAGTWTEVQTLKISDPEANDGLGNSLCFGNGGYLMVGCQSKNAAYGAVYTFA